MSRPETISPRAGTHESVRGIGGGAGRRPVANALPKENSYMSWRICLKALLLSLILLGLTTASQAAKPEWVKRHGQSSEHPSGEYLTGYGVASGDDALEQAKQAAAADLARKISVRIESEVSDVSREENGDYTYKIAAVTRSTTDVQLSSLKYEEPYKKRGKVYVLAWVRRTEAARSRRRDRDRAMSELRACMKVAAEQEKAQRRAAALESYETCRAPIASALQHDAVANALLPQSARDREVFSELVSMSRSLDGTIESMLKTPTGSLPSAADAMALQLTRQGVSKQSRIVVSHLGFGTTNLSSSFGRQAGIELERALAGTVTPVSSMSESSPRPDLAISGVYLEDGDRVRLSVTAREIETARLVASAESSLPSSSLPAHLELRPSNFEQALRDQKILAEGGLVSGDLQLEVWTDKGRGGVLYTEAEELKLYMRVNQAAWIRLVYVLQNGAQVPIDQGYYVDASKVNMVVEYPDSFEVVPPFGIEMIHATAFTKKPERLVTVEREIDGVHYEVVADGIEAVVRTRGLARRKKQKLAEDTLTVTTTPRF
jgi:hypothetical protein